MTHSWTQIPSDAVIHSTISHLTENGIEAMLVDTKEEAKETVLNIIPKKAEVMTMTSVTLTETGIEAALHESSDYDSVKAKLQTMNRETQSREMQRMGAAPEWSVGSVHAVTQDGVVLIASNTGSQLPGYVYGSDHVVWVVGAQKIVPDLDAGMKRLYEHVLPLESKRAQKAYGVPGSNVSKLLIVHKEVKPHRIQMILVKEALGF